tara:strand:- start:2580 stop:2738 length:159 start_codon:yes stop_codon:yes gene_type:complete
MGGKKAGISIVYEVGSQAGFFPQSHPEAMAIKINNPLNVLTDSLLDIIELLF